MSQQLFESCLPWAILVIVSVLGARILVWLSGARLQMRRIRSIHQCEAGSAQSLSFVLVLPFFVMTLMMIIQASHLMIGNIVVHYSAYAAARSASVWIPANVSFLEPANCISSRRLISEDAMGWQYEIEPSGDKFSKIRQAAVLAAFTLGPSRDLGYGLPTNEAALTAEALTNVYRGLNPSSVSNSKISQRLRNKLAYSYANTDVDITLWHRFREHVPRSDGRGPGRYQVENGNWSERFRDPPLYEYVERYDMYQDNEIGWQDHITATVTYNLPLLPGPIRFFAPKNSNPLSSSGQDPRTDSSGSAYVWPITGNATLGNEGQKPHQAYWQEEF